MGMRRGLVLLGGSRRIGREVAGGTLELREPRGRGWRAPRLQPERPAGAGGNRGNLCGRRGGSALGDRGSPAWLAPPPPTPPAPGEREALCPCWAAAEGGGEEAPGPSPVSSPQEGPEGEELYSDLSVRRARRWWAVVVLAALPSLGAGGEKNLEAPPESWTQLWFFRFLVNAAGYASFMVPGYLLVQYFRRKNYLETGVWGQGGGSVLTLD